MKKWISIVLLVLVGYVDANAQTFSEWFKQRKTQIKYYLEQIAQLQVHLKEVKKGYQLVSNGLNTIQQIKNGEFTLHNAFFGALSKIRPEIIQFANVAALVSHQVQLYKQYKRLLSDAIASRCFTPEEILLFQGAFTNLLTAMMQTLNEIVRVTTAGKLEMTDDERIKRINQLHEEVRSQEIHFTKMASSVNGAAAHRLTESVDIKMLKRWHDIP